MGCCKKSWCGEAWVAQLDYERLSINALGNCDGTGFGEVVFKARRVDILSRSDEDEAECLSKGKRSPSMETSGYSSG